MAKYRNILKYIDKNNVIHNSNIDILTRLPNRTSFTRISQLQCAEAKEKELSYALMILNIDGFKYLNGYLGHVLGDQLIVKISKLLKATLSNEIYLCRYSEDQFAILISHLTTKEEYDSIAKDIIGLCSNPFNIGKFELNINISIGICIYPENAQDCDSLTKNAAFALLRAKEDGKNTYSYYSNDMDIKYYKRFVLNNDLRKAIERNQLKVYYQPQVNLQTNEIIGAEALVRWEHPMWGLVSPKDFISTAEGTGYIIDIGKWMLVEVCYNYKQWLNNGKPAMKIAINYSSIQFLEKNFIEDIKNIINEYGLDPNFLIIEIIESVLINNFVQVISNIKSLQALGIQVAIDDFGTGFSSLEYLNKFNIDIIKIDKTFIQNVTIDKTSAIITTAVINMAQELGIQLIAEGIETWEQLSYLRDSKCDIGQGYLFSRPVPSKEFEIILAQKKCIPISMDDIDAIYDDRRKSYRIRCPELIKADMTILKNIDEKVKIGDTKVLLKDMGPGGLCFVSNIKLPIKSEIVLQFNIHIKDKEIKVYGYPVWIEKAQENLYRYGIEFIFDENMQKDLTGALNQYIIN